MTGMLGNMTHMALAARVLSCVGCLRQNLYSKVWGAYNARTRQHNAYNSRPAVGPVHHWYSTTSGQVPHVAVVGSGPAGFYTAQQILKGHPAAVVDVYEKLPIPFGLVRFGVAPDHPEVKNVISTFTQTAHHERCTFLGNVSVGQDVTISELRQAYTAVVLAYGADNDKTFGIPGEDLPEVMSARSFVGWYNGLPENRDFCPPLDCGDTAVVLGQGNVAVDVARILLTPVDILKKTDITDYALEALSHSRIRRVMLIGRRGPLQIALTVAELRELTKLPGCRPVLNPTDFQDIRQLIKDIPRRRKRLTELMVSTALDEPAVDAAARWAAADREWGLTFHRSPLGFLEKDGRLTGIRLAVNKLEGPPSENQKAIPTGDTEDLSCSIAFRSIGYKSSSLADEVPFDQVAGIIPNQGGQVCEQTGLYCSGWLKTGPVGVIVSTMNSSFETGKAVLSDLESGRLVASTEHTGQQAVLALLRQRGVKPVSFAEWEQVDKVETERGAAVDKPREKIVDIQEMLKIAGH